LWGVTVDGRESVMKTLKGSLGLKRKNEGKNLRWVYMYYYLLEDEFISLKNAGYLFWFVNSQ